MRTPLLVGSVTSRPSFVRIGPLSHMIALPESLLTTRMNALALEELR